MATESNNLQSQVFEIPPPIPLRRVDIPTNTEKLTMKLRTDPADAASQTYELTVCIFKTGTSEEWLLFMKDLKRVITGQAIATGPNKVCYGLTPPGR